MTDGGVTNTYTGHRIDAAALRPLFDSGWGAAAVVSDN